MPLWWHSVDEVFENKLVKLSLSSLLQFSSKLFLNAIIIRDSTAAGLSKYGGLCTKYLEPLKTLNCGIGGDRFQNVLLWAQNFPAISSLKNVVILCLTNNFFQDLPEEIADGVVEIAQSVQCSYNSINIAIGGILPHDASWSINQVLIKEVN